MKTFNLKKTGDYKYYFSRILCFLVVFTISVSIIFAQSISSAISSGSDDAEELEDSRISLTSSDLELVYDGSERGNQTVGCRFNNLGIPKDAVISSAHIRFAVDETNTTSANLTIRGEATDNAPTFTSTNGNISNRSTTIASVNWEPHSWDLEHDFKNTPDLKTIVQEIVNREGWAENNSMVFIITGTGMVSAESYEGAGGNTDLYPRLFVDFGGGGTTYTLTTVIEPEGSGSIDLDPAGGTYSSGQVVTITATNNSGYVFYQWSGDASGSANPYSLTMNDDKNVTANFNVQPPDQYSLNITITGSGSVHKEPDKSLYNDGEIVTLTAIDGSGYDFIEWGDDLTGSENPVDITMNSDKYIEAIFELEGAPPDDNIHIGSSTLCSVLIAPDDDDGQAMSEIILAEDNEGSMGMKLQYDGTVAGENKLKIFGKSYTSTYGPHLTIQRDNGYIGIGKVDPEHELDVSGFIRATDGFIFPNGSIQTVAATGSGSTLWNPGTEDRIFYNDGNVGIGTPEPNKDLEILNTSTQTTLRINCNYINWYTWDIASDRDGELSFSYGYSISTGNPSTSEKVRFLSDGSIIAGKVGIGTSSIGDYHLAVAGKIRATEIKVETDWYDFVFNSDYRLRPLNELEEYIKVNKKLPEIPGEEEVKANGISLGEMNAKLLQKIEEQTLYIIELNKKLEELQKEVNDLKNR